MKKIAIFFVIIISLVSSISYMYFNYTKNIENIRKENLEFEIYKDREIFGTELATLINKAIDTNLKNEVLKDNNGKYIDNKKNSIKIDIKFIDNDTEYNIEKIYNGGIQKFVNYYRDILFKCTNIEYHNSTGKIKYMKFKQVIQ